MLCRHTELQQYAAEVCFEAEFSYQAAAPGEGDNTKNVLAQMGRGGGANPCTVTKSYSMFGLVQCYDNNVVLKVFYGAVASSPIPESLPDPGHWT